MIRLIATAAYIFTCFIACHPLKNKGRMIARFDKQGHRGCRGLMPENTIPAMLHALDLNVTTLELDVVITKDKQVILSHEPFFNHEITAHPDGRYVTEEEEKQLNIFQMSFHETQAYDVGLKFHPRFPRQRKLKALKPLLSAVIDSAEAYARKKGKALPFYNIETKSQPVTDGIYHPAPEEFVRLIMDVVESKGIASRVIIQSFDARTLRVVHNKYPSIHTALLIEDDDTSSFATHMDTLGFSPAVYSPHYSLVNERLIKQCHDQQIRIIPWTVNEKRVIDSLVSLGVDGIITDYPDLFD